MTHVINPMWFYLCDVSDTVKLLAILAAIFTGTIGVVLFCIGLWNIGEGAEYGEDDCDYKFGVKMVGWARKFILPFVISLAISIFLPSENTLYKMMVANVATYENIDLTAETIEDAFDHVIDKLTELGDDKNAEN